MSSIDVIGINLPAGKEWKLMPGNVCVDTTGRVSVFCNSANSGSIKYKTDSIILINANLDIKIELSREKARLLAFDILRETDE